jgi:pimeloyl-ACP methyl ester carboxylesterase
MQETRVGRRPVQKEGLVGTLFYPTKADVPRPAVIVLGGLDGGLQEGSAAMLASEGFVALALGYFGPQPLFPEPIEIPLEYFAKAVSWLKAQPFVGPNGIAMVGVSKGGELALLLGATYPADIKAVVGYAPSAVAWRGVSYSLRSFFGSPRSSWTLEGEPVPFVDISLRFSEVVGYLTGKFPSLREMFERSLDDEAAVAFGSIAVEEIEGPVLLISGTDDQVWPSARFSEMVVERLKAYQHPLPYEHLRYEGAGHPTGLPYSGPINTRVGPMPLGGSLERNGFLKVDSWPKVVDFLKNHVK